VRLSGIGTTEDDAEGVSDGIGEDPEARFAFTGVVRSVLAQTFSRLTGARLLVRGSGSAQIGSL
jgi:hypothetical protein